jgi:hypothetical protein
VIYSVLRDEAELGPGPTQTSATQAGDRMTGHGQEPVVAANRKRPQLG